MSIHELDDLLNGCLYGLMAEWLKKKLLRAYGKDWWRNGVLQQLSDVQKETLKLDRPDDLAQLDLQALLHVFSKNFQFLTKHGDVSWESRTPLETVRGARNALSHRPGGKVPDAEDLLLYALNTKKLMIHLGAHEEDQQKAENLIRRLMTPEEGDPITDDESTQRDVPIDMSEKTGAMNLSAGDKEPAQSVSRDVLINPGAAPSTGDIKKIASEPSTTTVFPVTPTTEGENNIVKAKLLSVRRNDTGAWELSVKHWMDEAQIISLLHIPSYLNQSAKAAAEILGIVQQQENHPDVFINLLNVQFQNGSFHFPETLNGVGHKYPLLVIQPAYMVNVTSLTHFDYCPRQYLMDRYTFPENNAAMMRGTLVHNVFEAMLRDPKDTGKMLKSCQESIIKQLPRLAMQGTTAKKHYDEAQPHLKTLAKGVQKMIDPEAIEDLYIERFMVNPDFGLKGKIDALLYKKNGKWQAIELKTGRSWGARANDGHTFQVCAYQLMLFQSGIAELEPPYVLYTGNNAKKIKEGEAELSPDTMFKTVYFGPETAVQVTNLRNELVRIDYAGTLDFNSNANKCRKCSNAEQCVILSQLGIQGGSPAAENLQAFITQYSNLTNRQDRFQAYNQALLQEQREVRINHGMSLQQPVEKRILEGSCLEVAAQEHDPDQKTLRLTFPLRNASEIREGDPCLLSDVNGPVQGNCLEVYVSKIDKKQALVTLPDGMNKLWFAPAYLDTNSPDTAFERNFAALYSLWASTGPGNNHLTPLRAFLSGEPVTWPSNTAVPLDATSKKIDAALPLLPAQQKAVELAMGMNKLLLVQGPPGTGKTYTLACIVEALYQEGKNVLIATYTHRAADEVMSKMEAYTPGIPVRKLGRWESTSHRHNAKCLEQLLEQYEQQDTGLPKNKDTMLQNIEGFENHTRTCLSERTVYIGTTHAWLSGEYNKVLLNDPGCTRTFDVAVIDEASQIILPNILGVLRLAEKWILVGDHRQLPPVVLSEASTVLRKTLFELLAEACEKDPTILVPLDMQHRMPPLMADFIGEEFYKGKLNSAESCAGHRLCVNSEHALLKTQSPIVFAGVKNQGVRKYVRQSEKEALWITKSLKEIYTAGFPVQKPDGRPTAGVIAPYRAQVALIRRHMEEQLAGWGDADFWTQVVDTVDRFQGDERDVVFLSLCLDSTDGHVPKIYQEVRRINVALSRVRVKLYVVGELDALVGIPVLDRFFRYAEERKALILDADTGEPITSKFHTAQADIF